VSKSLIDSAWFEPARDFVTSLNRAEYAVKERNLESQKEFLEKIGSNFIFPALRDPAILSQFWCGKKSAASPFGFAQGMIFRRKLASVLTSKQRPFLTGGVLATKSECFTAKFLF